MTDEEKSARERLLDRIAKLEREKVELIAKHGQEALMYRDKLVDCRKEMNEQFNSGLLLMRELIRVRMREDERIDAETVRQCTDIRPGDMSMYVDNGLYHLRPDALALYAEMVWQKIR